MEKLTKDQLENLLKENECVVEFTKLNGEYRRMPCTLREDLLPKPIKESSKKQNETVLSVWCTDKKEWRSFKVDSVISIKVNDVFV